MLKSRKNRETEREKRREEELTTIHYIGVTTTIFF